jgi:hypothetical protein
LPGLFARLRLGASTVYIATSTGEFGTLENLTGVFTQTKASGTGLNGIAFDNSGNLDAIDLGGSPNLGFYRVNVSTGAGDAVKVRQPLVQESVFGV